MATQNVQFGSGVLYMRPTLGNLATNPTPYRVGVMQDASVDFKGDLKKLYGQKQFPVATARGKIDVEGKSKLCVFDAGMLSQVYFGLNATSGLTKIADQEPGTIPTTPFQVTVTNSATWVKSYAVQKADGTHFQEVASAPATGQYSVAAGVYTFAAADTGLAVVISYSYTVAATGKSLAITNQLMGYAPECEIFLYNAFRTNAFGLKLVDCTLGSVNVPTKNEDFWMVDITFSANADSTDNVGNLYIQ